MTLPASPSSVGGSSTATWATARLRDVEVRDNIEHELLVVLLVVAPSPFHDGLHQSVAQLDHEAGQATRQDEQHEQHTDRRRQELPSRLGDEPLAAAQEDRSEHAAEQRSEPADDAGGEDVEARSRPVGDDVEALGQVHVQPTGDARDRAGDRERRQLDGNGPHRVRLRGPFVLTQADDRAAGATVPDAAQRDVA